MWEGMLLQQLGQELRFAARSLGKSPGFAALSILTLALELVSTQPCSPSSMVFF